MKNQKNTKKKNIDIKKTRWYKPKDWEFRDNTKRKQDNKGKHPSLVVGENEDTYANLGLTHSAKRGHHKNIELSKNPNPKDKKKSYVRDDLQYDEKKHLKNVLKDYKKLTDKDIEKISKAEAIEKLNQNFNCNLQTDLPTLLIFGGSQGAQVFNINVPQALKELDKVYKFQVLPSIQLLFLFFVLLLFSIT